jgi:hypothetical protein
LKAEAADWFMLRHFLGGALTFFSSKIHRERPQVFVPNHLAEVLLGEQLG